jgi:hypothetical protein
MKTKLAATGGATQTFVDDVFSTYLYNGNGSTQTITNGIDLAGKGGLVWQKRRDGADDNFLSDTTNGLSNPPLLISNQTGGLNYQGAYSPVNQFLSTGFNMTSLSLNNDSGQTFVSWTFRKAPKFFDVVTYTGNGAGFGDPYTINHNLGVTPAIVIIKNTSSVGHWFCFARGESGYYDLFLSLTAAASPSSPHSAANYNLTASSFDPAKFQNLTSTNTNGQTYVAYLFAHDTSATGIIQCGSFTTDGSGNATVNLGWEPQFLIRKTVTGDGGNWVMLDSMRGMTASNSVQSLYPNLSNEENTSSGTSINATGFTIAGFTASATQIYMAIRRSNKPPTLGTQVFAPVINTGNDTAGTVLTAGFPVDLTIGTCRNYTGLTYSNFVDRLRGEKRNLQSGTSNVEFSDTTGLTSYANQTGIVVGNGTANSWSNQAPWLYINWMFKRASGFFDVVCYTGAYSAVADQVVNHNLNVSPELIILKKRNTSGFWAVISTTIGLNKYLTLNSSDVSSNFTFLNSVSPSSFSLNKIADNYSETNSTYVAYLFATLVGISKVGSYTGNGSSQNIECGFAAGARIILIKRTDSTGDWYVWDTARGIVSNNDPHLSLNTYAAEVTTDDSVDPYSAGFAVNQVAATNINVSSATYIFLAIS